jgi:plasmid stabilization system protein ParE
MRNAAIRFHPAAAQEFWSALAWYKARSVQAAQRFRVEFKRLAKRLAAAPEHGTPYRQAYFWMRMRRFPYLLYYQVVDPTQVIILAVAHSRRRAGYWLKRTRP